MLTTTRMIRYEPEGCFDQLPAYSPLFTFLLQKKARRRRLWIAGASVLGVLLLLLLLFVVAMAMARLRVTATGVMIESDIPQFTRPPNAVSAALWLRGQAEYAFTNPGYLTVCVNHVDASFFYVDQAGVTPGAAPTLTKVTPASTVDLMFPRGGPQRNDRTIDTCVAPGSTVKLQIPFEVRVMLSPPLTQSIADDCSASAQRFAVDVLGSGASYVGAAIAMLLISMHGVDFCVGACSFRADIFDRCQALRCHPSH